MVALLLLVAGVLVVALLGALTAWSLVKAIFWLVLLPFRMLFGLLAGILVLPFLLVKGLLFFVAALVCIIVLPIVFVSIVAAAAPFLPLLLLGIVVWAVLRSRRTAAA
jgi:hypothetical protein